MDEQSCFSNMYVATPGLAVMKQKVLSGEIRMEQKTLDELGTKQVEICSYRHRRDADKHNCLSSMHLAILELALIK